MTSRPNLKNVFSAGLFTRVCSLPKLRVCVCVCVLVWLVVPTHVQYNCACMLCHMHSGSSQKINYKILQYDIITLF